MIIEIVNKMIDNKMVKVGDTPYLLLYYPYFDELEKEIGETPGAMKLVTNFKKDDEGEPYFRYKGVEIYRGVMGASTVGFDELLLEKLKGEPVEIERLDDSLRS